MDNTVATRTVVKINANPLLVLKAKENRQLRVAAYCRVSTDMEEQINSYEAQIAYYTEAIAKNPSWTFAGIYADEGITGTATKKRKDFLRLMRDCEKGKIDMILTKSISRFARNTVDSLSWVRKLRAMGIGVYFEEQAIDSLKAENEMLIGLFSVIAQSESENISANVRWGIQQRMKSGTYSAGFKLLGYRKSKDGEIQIVPEEADIVKTIFERYLDGASIDQLKKFLEGNHVKTSRDKTEWSYSVIRDMLSNEKYVGDVLTQKTFRVDCISKKVKKNRGELTKYLISNNHTPIIDRDTFNRVQMELSRRSSKRKKSDLSITEQGKYSGKYALTELLICGECGSSYRRTSKVSGEKHIFYWRCVNRIDHGTKYCKQSIGIEEEKLKAAICRCLSGMMKDGDEVRKVIQTNLTFAISGNEASLDAYSIETQIKQFQEDINMMMERSVMTGGETDRYEAELKKMFDKVVALRNQLELAKSKAENNDLINSEVENLLTWFKSCDVSFSEYDDLMVRRLVECIQVMSDHRIVITLKGGFRGEEVI